MKIYFLKSFLKIIFILMLGVFCLSPFVVSANSTHNMSGYAWSSNVGWISFNCTNSGDNNCTTYGVHKDASGFLTGYAWSSNVGWIQFGGLSGFPANGNGTQQINAKVNGNNLQGWAKVVSTDGWISMGGESNGTPGTPDQWVCHGNSFDESDECDLFCDEEWSDVCDFDAGSPGSPGPSYGVNLTDNNFSGYAWGSEVVGWVNFNGVIVGAATADTLTGSDCIIQEGASTCTTTLSWSVPNPEVILGSAVTSNTNNSGNTSANFFITPPVSSGNADVGTKSNVIIPYINGGIVQGRTFFLYNNAKQLAVVIVTASCDVGTSWDGTKCTNLIGSAVCGNSIVESPETCDLGSGNGVCPSACSNSCTINSCGGGSGDDCSSPSEHYLCDDGSIGTNQKSSPSKWTWTCGSASCSQKKSPGYVED